MATFVTIFTHYSKKQHAVLAVTENRDEALAAMENGLNEKIKDLGFVPAACIFIKSETCRRIEFNDVCMEWEVFEAK